MKQTIVGVFDRHAAAVRAAQMLHARGFGSVQVSDEVGSVDHPHDSPPDTGVVAHIRSFLAEVFGPDENLAHLAQTLHRGGAVVKVEADDAARLDAARQTLQEAGAVSIEERAG
jgi:hypothetical protein